MALENLFKLEKLKLGAYDTPERSGRMPRESFEVMFNPESFSMRHENVYGGLQGISTGGARAVYSHTRSQELSLSLVFDGTGVGEYGLTNLLGLGKSSVADQIDRFLKLCFYMDGELHEPKSLRLQWGEGPLKAFDCRLASVDITYTSFDRNGAPLRATLAAVFVEDGDRTDEKRSPDLSHIRVVKSGDTLPLLCKEIYGSPKHYLRVARSNRLDNFRALIPGQELVFPPLAKRGAR